MTHTSQNKLVLCMMLHQPTGKIPYRTRHLTVVYTNKVDIKKSHEN